MWGVGAELCGGCAASRDLRTRFEETNGQGFQVIDEPGGFRLKSWTCLVLGLRRGKPKRVVASVRGRRMFDLAGGPLFRARVLRLGLRTLWCCDCTTCVGRLSLGGFDPGGWFALCGVCGGDTSPLPALAVQYCGLAV